MPRRLMRFRYRHFHKRENPFYDPERAASVSTRPYRARRELLLDLVKQDPRYLEIPNFRARLGGLSQVDKKSLNESRRLVKGREARPKADLRSAAIAGLAKYKKLTADEFARLTALEKKKYRSLRSRASGQNLDISGADKRRYDPTGKDYAVHRSGRIADYVTAPVMSSSWVQVFKNPGSVVPCIQRHQRQEVMFALGYAGRGYRVKHRRTWKTGVPC